VAEISQQLAPHSTDEAIVYARVASKSASPVWRATSRGPAAKSMSSEATHHEKLALQQLADESRQYWTPSQTEYLNRTKRCIIGSKTNSEPSRSGLIDSTAACGWDCHRRASMLEPLAADVLRRNIPGDFIEAGVFKGGVSIFMAATLRAAGLLGEDSVAAHRRMWVADSFQGLPNVTYTWRFADSESARSAGLSRTDISNVEHAAQWRQGKAWHSGGQFRGPLGEVKANFAKCLAPWPPPSRRLESEAASSSSIAGVHFLTGFFADTLPGPVERLALIRADSDLFASVYETIDALYPKLSVGGYIVFDDWKIHQARVAITTYRERHNITSPLRCAGERRGDKPFDTIDRMAFWRKDDRTG
jgi:hypothetical protein